MTTKELTREQKIDTTLDAVFALWKQCASLDQPTDQERKILATAFVGNLKKRQFAMLRNPPSWQGYKRRDGTIDQQAFDRCLANVLGKMLQWHRSGGYLGTVFNSQWQGNMLGKELWIENLFDKIETFSILLLKANGIESSAVKAWERALHGR